MSGTRLKNDTGRPFARWTDGRTDGRRFGSIERKTDDSSVKNTGVTKSIFFKTSRKCTFVIFAIFRRLFIGQMFEPVFETTNSASVRPSNLSYQTLREKRREAEGGKKKRREEERKRRRLAYATRATVNIQAYPCPTPDTCLLSICGHCPSCQR